MIKTQQLNELREKANVGEIIRLLMISKDIKPTELANELRVTPAYINAIINNVKVPSIRLLTDFFEHFKIPFEKFSYLVDFYNNYTGKEKFEHTLYETLKIVVETLEE